MSDISVRAKRILHAVVSEYLATGEPVGSETVTRRYTVEVSPATVRNVMGDLEELGLLRHTHTSAGRIPTDRGLRYYVDTLLRVRSLSQVEKDGIRGQMVAGGDVQQVMHRTTRVLRDLSHLAVVVQTPRPESDAISSIEFVRLRDNNLLAVIAAASGQITNKLVTTETPLTGSELERIHNYLNDFAVGLTLGELRSRLAQQIEDERLANDQLVSKALALASAAVPSPSADANLLVDGQSNLLNATEDLERAKRVLRTLEEKDLIVRLLDRTLAAPGICVFIGAEANLPDLTDISVVTANYGGEGGRPLGTIGVIGPSRMNYSKVIPLVDFTAEVITEALPKL
ncbi:MAG TPA: heat-inducible transcriptional repressor HrcA [Polyangia bacterium]